MATIQVRIDDQTKTAAKEVLAKLGLDMSSAIKMYLSQIVIRKGIPFRVLTENGLTVEQEDEILRSEAEALAGKNIITTHTWAETKAHLDSLKK